MKRERRVDIYNATIFGLNQVFQKCFALIWGVLLAKYLGPTSYGVLSFAISMVTILGCVIDFGNNQNIVQRAASNDSYPDAAYGNTLSLVFVLGAVAIALIVAGNFFRPMGGDVVNIIICLLIGQVFLSMGMIGFSILQAINEFTFLSYCQGALRIATLGIGALILFSVPSPLIYIAILISALNVVFFVASVFTLQRVRPTRLIIEPRGWLPLLKDAAPFGVALVLSTAYFRIDNLILTGIKGPEANGVYNAAYRCLDAVLFLPATVSAILFPRLSSLYLTDREEFRQILQTAYIALLQVGCFIGVSLALLSPIIANLLGPTYRDVNIVLPLLCMSVPLIFSNYILTYGVASLRLSRWLVYINLACLIVNISSNIILNPTMGAEGAAIATFLTEIVIVGGAHAVLAVKVQGFMTWGRVLYTAAGVVPLVLIPMATFFLSGTLWVGLVAATTIFLLNVVYLKPFGPTFDSLVGRLIHTVGKRVRQ